MEQQNQTTELDLLGLLLHLKKRLWILAAAFAVCALAGFVFSSFLMSPQYTAETRMYVLNRSTEGQLAYSDIQISTYVLYDYQGLITGQNVAREVISQLNLTDTTPDSLASKIQVSSPEGTRILQITVTDSDPQRAADIANAVREESGKQIKEIMEVDAVKLVYEAEVPKTPSSPNVMRNTVLAAIIGLVGAAAVLAAFYLMDDTIRTEEDVAKWLGLSVLGAIPATSGLNVANAKNPAPAKRGSAAKTSALQRNVQK